MAAARSSERRPSARTAALAGVAVAVLAVVYPWALEGLLQRLGARGLALLLLGILGASLPLRGATGAFRGIGAAGLAGLLALGAASGDARFLRLVPAWIYVGLAALFATSLRGPGSILERAARWLVPEAPAFIRGYCRALTALWVAFFLASAAIIGWLAVAETSDAWTSYTSRVVWIAMGALSGIEFLVRKTWFRYYFRGGPFERVWSRWFPAERTARGRRSLQYIAEYRERMARKATLGRAE